MVRDGTSQWPACNMYHLSNMYRLVFFKDVSPVKNMCLLMYLQRISTSCTPCSRKDEIRNVRRNAKHNPNPNQETFSLGFSFENLKRDLER